MTADWRAAAACLGSDPALFDPRTDGDVNTEYRIRTAQALCTACPVRQVCYDEAVSWGDTYGIAGGAMFVDGKVKGHRVGPRIKATALQEQRAELRTKVLQLTASGWAVAAIADYLQVQLHTVWRIRGEAKKAAA